MIPAAAMTLLIGRLRIMLFFLRWLRGSELKLWLAAATVPFIQSMKVI